MENDVDVPAVVHEAGQLEDDDSFFLYSRLVTETPEPVGSVQLSAIVPTAVPKAAEKLVAGPE